MYELFGDADCNELIELSHASPAWVNHYNESKKYIDGEFFNNYNQNKRVIPKDELVAEVRMIKNMLHAYEHRDELGY
jgi:hypothetical protein